MAFTDPQSITIAAVPISLPRVNSGNRQSEYGSADGLTQLKASTAQGQRLRQVLRIDHAKITADPFIPTQNSRVSMSNYLVFDRPPAGFTNAQAKEVYDGFIAMIGANSAALVTKLLGGES